MSKSTCSVEDCAGSRYGHGYCQKHWKRWRKYGSTELPQRKLLKDSICSLPDCTKPHGAGGYCTAHYTRLIRYGDPTYRIAGEVIDGKRICPACGIDKPLSEWGKSYCRLCVNKRAATDNPYKPVEKTTAVCEICDSPFMADKRRRFTCSLTCKLERKRLKDIELSSKRDRAIANNSTRRWYAENRATAYDSKAKYRARKRAAFVEDVQREVVFQRDAWLCMICLSPLDLKAKSPHPDTPSVDHIIPLALGGAHSYDNCQSAHLRCNTAKGARIA